MKLTGYWDRNLAPITAAQWGRLFGDLEYRTIARTPVEPGTVITMWLGHDGEEGPGIVPDDRMPLIFGTLLWDGREFFDATEADARARHEHWARWARCWRNSGASQALDDENEWVHERVNAGDSLSNIGREIGVSPQALGRRLRRYRNRLGLEGRVPYPGNRHDAINPGAYRGERRDG